MAKRKARPEPPAAVFDTPQSVAAANRATMERIVEARARFHKHKNLFQHYFGVPLADFWDVRSLAGVFTGFDVVKLDEVVKPAEDESTAEAILRLHGKEAHDMVLDLLGPVPTAAGGP